MILTSAFLLVLACAPDLSSAVQLPWPWGRTPSSRSLRRSRVSEASLNSLRPPDAPFQIVGVRKMSDDEGEMFFPEYWTLSGVEDLSIQQQQHHASDPLASESSQFNPSRSSKTSDNSTLTRPLYQPFAIHAADYQSPFKLLLPRLLERHYPMNHLHQRDFQCPSDTTPCTSIDRPNSCCGTGETCQLVADSGSGDVGCCPQGSGTCSDEVSGCAEGYESCPADQGGGCCVPGYRCAGVGCVIDSTTTVVINPTATLPRSSSSPSPSSSPLPLSTETFTTATTRLFTVTSPSPSPSSTPSSTPSTTVRSTSPSSITATHTTATPTAALPVRPTSGTLIQSQCPTGFYACSAYDHPGCCRVGRDCSISSCPPGGSSTSLVLTSNGVAIGGAVGATPSEALGQSGCAAGWYRCEASTGLLSSASDSGGGGGGGCCPSGYMCGESCTASGVVTGSGGATGVVKVAKDNATSSLRIEAGRGWWRRIGASALLVGALWIWT